MQCPKCKSYESKVIDSRPSDNGIRRRRECLDCGERFSTWEFIGGKRMKDFFDSFKTKMLSLLQDSDNEMKELIEGINGR